MGDDSNHPDPGPELTRRGYTFVHEPMAGNKATSTTEEGPIIAQGVTRVSHRDTVAEMERKGRDLERVVLAPRWPGSVWVPFPRNRG